MLFRLLTMLLLTGLIVGCASAAPPEPPTPAPAPTSEWDAPADRYLGIFQGDAGLEKQIGQEFSIHLYYHPWGNAFGTLFEEAAREGRIALAT